jgi:hypothetical protein
MPATITNFEAVWFVYHSKPLLFAGKRKLIWFSADDIQQLHQYLQNNGRSGVRIYEAKYPKHDRYSSINGHDYRNRKTLVLVPTILNGKVHEDEISEAEVQEVVRRIKKGNIPHMLAFNHGELCPPNCDGDFVDSNT